MAERIAVVTGANRGIGFEICRQLARSGVRVLLTARDVDEGEQAAASLRAERLNVLFHRLDVTDGRSIRALGNAMLKTYRRCDILVNNAGIMLHGDSVSVMKESMDAMRTTVATNVYGPLQLMQTLLPLMRRHRYGRVVNLSSGYGQLSDMQDGSPAYRLSKAALNALTCMFASAMEGSNVLVNSMCPGWVRTDMGGPQASRSVAKGAETARWLATLPDGGPSGGFFRDKRRIAW